MLTSSVLPHIVRIAKCSTHLLVSSLFVLFFCIIESRFLICVIVYSLFESYCRLLVTDSDGAQNSTFADAVVNKGWTALVLSFAIYIYVSYVLRMISLYLSLWTWKVVCKLLVGWFNLFQTNIDHCVWKKLKTVTEVDVCNNE